MLELQAMSPQPSDDPKKFKRWLIKIVRESDAPLKADFGTKAEADGA